MEKFLHEILVILINAAIIAYGYGKIHQKISWIHDGLFDKNNRPHFMYREDCEKFRETCQSECKTKFEAEIKHLSERISNMETNNTEAHKNIWKAMKQGSE